jgi:hypothetical protein
MHLGGTFPHFCASNQLPRSTKHLACYPSPFSPSDLGIPHYREQPVLPKNRTRPLLYPGRQMAKQWMMRLMEGHDTLFMVGSRF